MSTIKGILNKSKNNENSNNDDHNHQNLVLEMEMIETLTTAERLHLAKVRRAQQLKVAKQKEKEWLKILKMNQKNNIPMNTHSKKNVNFENSVVLLEAASRNDIAEVADLLSSKQISPNVCNEDGLTALHQCCIDNKVDMLKLLIEHGANVNAEDSDKWTPLHAAATCGHLTLVKLLIAHGANLLAVNTDGNMPYDLCDEEECLDYIEYEMSERSITQELIDDIRSSTEKKMLNDLICIANDGGDVEFIGKQGESPLHTACANGYVSVVEFLLSQHVNPDATDKDLWTPVHAAACWGHLEVLELLAQYGADLNMENKDGETPTDICEDLEIRERLEQLKFEQENKKIADAQKRKVKRSQSNNTRAQSVRRTSLRDKTMTTKKDAVEEVRLRMRAQEVYSNLDNPENISTNDTIDSSSSLANSKFDTSQRTEPEGEANNTPTSEIVEDNTTVSNSLKKSNSADNFSADFFQSSKDNGKINVQVTVLVDTQNIDNSISRTTLSNLKKQRLQYRNICLQSTDSAGSPQQENNSISFQNYDDLVRLSKQNQYVNKFSGVAPDTADYRKCCNIS